MTELHRSIALAVSLLLAACAGTPPAEEVASTSAPTSTPRVTASLRPTEAPSASPRLGSAPVGAIEVATVLSITDGDTIRVDRGFGSEPVRYIGINTPEVGDPGGSEATAENARLLVGMEVVLEKDVSETDQFDRLLRYVWLDTGGGWTLVNFELVRRGFAQAATYPPDVRLTDLFLAAEQGARTAGAGLWAPTPAPTPAPTAAPTPGATPAPTPPPTTAPPVVTPAPVANCHPSYVGVCLQEGIGDYDCAGGSGNGPNYIAGPFQVVGYDEFDLDRDGDGIGCE